MSVYDEYDLESGLKRDELWWLCDHKEHCEDGTDESNGKSGNLSNNSMLMVILLFIYLFDNKVYNVNSKKYNESHLSSV